VDDCLSNDYAKTVYSDSSSDGTTRCLMLQRIENH
jgi:hypothetical protein